MYLEYDDIQNPLQFTIDTILKEAKEESRLVKQIFYTMLSAYTNNPINLAINSPSGEGKTYVLQKVGLDPEIWNREGYKICFCPRIV